MIYDKVLFLVSLIIWHTCKAFSFSAKFLLLTLSNKAQPLPPMWYVNEWMWGHFDFGSVSTFVSAFFCMWKFTLWWPRSCRLAGHTFEVGAVIKICYAATSLWNKHGFLLHVLLKLSCMGKRWTYRKFPGTYVELVVLWYHNLNLALRSRFLMFSCENEIVQDLAA